MELQQLLISITNLFNHLVGFRGLTIKYLNHLEWLKLCLAFSFYLLKTIFMNINFLFIFYLSIYFIPKYNYVLAKNVTVCTKVKNYVCVTMLEE